MSLIRAIRLHQAHICCELSEGLTAKYSDGNYHKMSVLDLIFDGMIESPEVLRNLSFEIKSGERVGIGELPGSN